MNTTTGKWHQQRVLAVDTETTGTSVHEDRIVTAAVVDFKPGLRPVTRSWVIDPGVEIGPEAAAVHGWTNDRLTAYRDQMNHPARKPEEAVFEIAGILALAMSCGAAVVACNAAFDLSIIEAESRRHGLPTLAERLAPQGIRGVVDPQVLDKQYDPYRKSCYKAPGCDVAAKHHECGGCRGGKYECDGCGATDRTLTSLCAHYGVIHTGAHDASGDALAAWRVTSRLVAAWPDVARLRLPTLHAHQVTWRKEQSDSLRDFWKRTGDERWREVCGSWPVHGDCCANTPTVRPEQGAAL